MILHHDNENVVQVWDALGDIALMSKHWGGRQGQGEPRAAAFLNMSFTFLHSGSWDCRRSGTERAGATGGTLKMHRVIPEHG